MVGVMPRGARTPVHVQRIESTSVINEFFALTFYQLSTGDMGTPLSALFVVYAGNLDVVEAAVADFEPTAAQSTV